MGIHTVNDAQLSLGFAARLGDVLEPTGVVQQAGVAEVFCLWPASAGQRAGLERV